jgi:thiol-disulfide isomerase/thioredoxin
MSASMRHTGMKALMILLALGSAAHADVLKVGDRLAELDIAVDAGGKPFKLKSLKGKWVVVTVGAEWCQPCAKELPTWDRLAGEMNGKITFVAVGLDEKIDDAKHFHDRLKLHNMTRVYMPADKSGVAPSYGSDHMPSTFVADPKGVVRYVREGFEKGDTDGEYKALKAELDKLMK